MPDPTAAIPDATSNDVRILLIERAGCHLCDEAHRVLDEVSEITGERWLSVDVDSAPALREEYGELVPVVLVDGDIAGYWRLDTTNVCAALGLRTGPR